MPYKYIVQMPDDLRKRLAYRAIEQGIARAEFVRNAIEQALAEQNLPTPKRTKKVRRTVRRKGTK